MALHAYTPPLHAVKTGQPHFNVLICLSQINVSRNIAALGGTTNAKLQPFCSLSKQILLNKKIDSKIFR